MHLSLREKQSFYDHLAQLLRAGVALPAALQKLASTSRGSTRAMLKQLGAELLEGKTAPEAFATLRPHIGEMEQTAIAALERSGRMDRGLQQLSDYFGAMDKARGEILRRSAYPLFVLHFALLLVHVTELVSGGELSNAGIHAYLRDTGFSLLVVYAVGGILLGIGSILAKVGAENATADWLLRLVPIAGKLRRAFALTRFCATYDMQLEAGVNVLDSLQSAGKASRSGLIVSAVNNAMPEIRQGGQVGPQLARSSAFPESFTRTVLVAEETGELDKALARLTAQYQNEALTRLSTLSEWIPRLLYIGIMLYVGWVIIDGYRHYLNDVMKQIDG